MNTGTDTPVAASAHGLNPKTWWLGGILCVAVYVGLLLSGGEARDLAIAGSEALPFVLLAVLAYAGARWRWARVLTWVWAALITLVVAVLAVNSTYEALRPEAGGLSDAGRSRLLLVGGGVALGLIAGWLCGLPGLRRALARVLPLDPASFVHAAALVVIVAMTLVLFVPVAVLGAPPFLEAIEQGDTSGLQGDTLDDLYGLFWLLPGAVFAVGFPFIRSWRAALARLGLVWPTRGQVALALVGGALMVVVFIAINAAIFWLWDRFGWPVTDTETFEELMAYSLTPLGAVVIGVTAGLGEEVAVRGVLQPRLGLLLSNLFFTALHALQYNFDALLSVFLAGLVLGWVRRRTNTTVSAVVHGFYDFLLIMLAVLSAPGFS